MSVVKLRRLGDVDFWTEREMPLATGRGFGAPELHWAPTTRRILLSHGEWALIVSQISRSIIFASVQELAATAFRSVPMSASFENIVIAASASGAAGFVLHPTPSVI